MKTTKAGGKDVASDSSAYGANDKQTVSESKLSRFARAMRPVLKLNSGKNPFRKPFPMKT